MQHSTIPTNNKRTTMIPAFFLSATNIETNPLVMKITSALLILFAGLIIGKITGLIIQKIFHQLSVDKHLTTTIGYRFALKKHLSTIITSLIYTVAIIITLQQLSILKYALIIIGGGAIFIILISIILEGIDAIPNLFSGIILKHTKKILVGDKIIIRSINGEIQRIGLFISIIKEKEDEIQIPNRLFIKEPYVFKKKVKRK